MVEAIWIVKNSLFFSEEEKERIHLKLVNRINKEGELLVRSSESRSQLKNKEIATKKIIELVDVSLYIPKSRRPSGRTQSSIEQRLSFKKKVSEIKKLRNKNNW